jgi:hypothetical protein
MCYNEISRFSGHAPPLTNTPLRKIRPSGVFAFLRYFIMLKTPAPYRAK